MKEYKTKEECIKENGEHAWRKEENKGATVSCAVYHLDGYCSWNDPVEKCYHCPAIKTYTRIQPEIRKWIDEEGKEIVNKSDNLSTTTLNIGVESITTLGGSINILS